MESVPIHISFAWINLYMCFTTRRTETDKFRKSGCFPYPYIQWTSIIQRENGMEDVKLPPFLVTLSAHPSQSEPLCRSAVPLSKFILFSAFLSMDSFYSPVKLVQKYISSLFHRSVLCRARAGVRTWVPHSLWTQDLRGCQKLRNALILT